MSAPSGLIVAWPSTVASIPSGWSRVAALNSNHPKASTTAGTTGGSSTHTHTAGSHQHTDTHSHAATNSANFTQDVSIVGDGTGSSFPSIGTHNHTLTPGATSFSINSDAGSNSSSGTITLQTTFVIWIQSDGTTDIPSGAVMWWNTVSPPTNWAYADGSSTTPDLRNNYLLGASAGGDGGSQVAAASHTHTYSHGHTATAHSSHAITVGVKSSTLLINPGSTTVAVNHAHSVGSLATASTTPGSSYGTDATVSDTNTPEPLFYKLLPIKKTASDSTIPQGLIGWTVGATPSNFTVCDGTLGTPNLNGNSYFIKGAATTGEISNTGGSANHTHTITHGHSVPAHTHTLSGTSGAADTSNNLAGVVSAMCSSGHTHTASGASGAIAGSTTVANTGLSLPANGTNDPQFSTTIYVMSLAPIVVSNPIYPPNRVPNPLVGPPAWRIAWRPTPIQDITGTPLTDTNFGPVRSRIPFNGPPVLRFFWRQRPVTSDERAILTNTEFGPIESRMPNRRVGPPVLRQRAAERFVIYGDVRNPTLWTQTLTGVLNALSGTLVASHTFLQTLTGAMGNLTGTLVKTTNKVLTGSPASLAGTVIKSTSKFLVGAPASMSGTVVRLTKKILTGTPALSGTISASSRLFRSFTGAINPAGSVGLFQLVRKAKMKAGNIASSVMDAGNVVELKNKAASIVSRIMRGGNTRRW